MSHPEDRSGRNPQWVAGLADMAPDECRAFIASLVAVEMKTCEAEGCPAPAAYRVSFHGCRRTSVCDKHRAVWAAGIARVIQHNGSIVCELCDGRTSSLEATMQWFPI